MYPHLFWREKKYRDVERERERERNTLENGTETYWHVFYYFKSYMFVKATGIRIATEYLKGNIEAIPLYTLRQLIIKSIIIILIIYIYIYIYACIWRFSMVI